jgi:hypothetical protein
MDVSSFCDDTRYFVFEVRCKDEREEEEEGGRISILLS